MIKKYRIKDPIVPIKEIYSIESLPEALGQEGFLIIVLNTLNPDEIYDAVQDVQEVFESLDIKQKVIIVSSDVEVKEALRIINESDEEPKDAPKQTT